MHVFFQSIYGSKFDSGIPPSEEGSKLFSMDSGKRECNVNRVVVVIVPLPAQGHLNQHLHLSRLLSSYDIPVRYVGPESYVDQAVRRYAGGSLAAVNFHPIPTPPPPIDADPSPDFGDQLARAVKSAISPLSEPIYTLVLDLAASFHRVVVIHDSLLGSVVNSCASISNVELYAFNCISGYASHSIQIGSFSMDGCFSANTQLFMEREKKYLKSCSGIIYNTCRALEAFSIEQLLTREADQGRSFWALGPLIISGIKRERNHVSHSCIGWLDQQPDRSVVFVSFGTTSSMSKGQVVELALGLKKSGQRFLWVLRKYDVGGVNAELAETGMLALPQGFEQEVGDRGIVVREWAPQVDILAHPSVGGFVSHCGWNSCMESLTSGVPIAAWPMQFDQPYNAVLLANLGVGIMVREWDRREVLVACEIVELAIRRLMGSDEGQRMRRRAAELALVMRVGADEGGEVRIQRDSFVEQISNPHHINS